MGNTDSIPIVSQIKSFTEYVAGDAAGARHTQENFAYNNTFPVISQIASAGYAIGGDPGRAKDLQEKFAKDMERVIGTIPVAGHIEGGVYYALGDKEKGERAMKDASRSTGVVIGGVGGFLAGGPAGAVAGGIAGGAAADGIITGSDILAKGKENATDSGYIAAGKQIKSAIEGKTKLNVDEAFDIAMLPVSDGVGGYVSGNIIGEAVGGLKPGEVITTDVGHVKNGPINSAFDTNANSAAGKVSKTAELDQKALDNRANQLNPNHAKSGPGREARYRGKGTKADLDNRSNQMNPNNKAYIASRQQTAANPAPAVAINANPAQEKLQQAQSDEAAASKTGGALKTAASAAASTGSFLKSLFGGLWQLIMVLISIMVLVLSILASVITCICKRRSRSNAYVTLASTEDSEGEGDDLIRNFRNPNGYSSINIPV